MELSGLPTARPTEKTPFAFAHKRAAVLFSIAKKYRLRRVFGHLIQIHLGAQLPSHRHRGNIEWKPQNEDAHTTERCAPASSADAHRTARTSRRSPAVGRRSRITLNSSPATVGSCARPNRYWPIIRN